MYLQSVILGKSRDESGDRVYGGQIVSFIWYYAIVDISFVAYISAVQVILKQEIVVIGWRWWWLTDCLEGLYQPPSIL